MTAQSKQTRFPPGTIDRPLLERAAAELGNISPAAIGFTEKLLNLDPSDRVRVLMAIAIDCAKDGDFEKANNWIQVARELEPQCFTTADKEDWTPCEGGPSHLPG